MVEVKINAPESIYSNLQRGTEDMEQGAAKTPGHLFEEIEVETTSQFTSEKNLLKVKVKRLEDMLFARGAMEEAPCFCCGYNGPGYYQPAQHPCAARHHNLVHNYEMEAIA